MQHYFATFPGWQSRTLWEKFDSLLASHFSLVAQALSFRARYQFSLKLIDQAASQPAVAQQRVRLCGENVLRLLALREVAPSVKSPLRRLWGDVAASSVSYCGHYREVTDAKRALISWLAAESLRHCTAKYCPLLPAPRLTIAAAFCPDGNTRASTQKKGGRGKQKPLLE